MIPSATIIGYGRMGREHEKAYHEMGVDVVAIGNEHDWEDHIGKSKYLSICSPDTSHAKQVMAGLAAGQAVFCEKPLCLTNYHLTMISRLGIRLGINYPLRHCEHFEELDWWTHQLEWVYHWGRGHKRNEGWRKDMADYSPILAGGCHLVDHALYKNPEEKIIPLAGYRPRPLVQICSFYAAGQIGQLICDLESDDGDHYQRMNNWINRKPTDKTACLKRFIEGEDTRDICLEGMRICLEMDRLSQG